METTTLEKLNLFDIGNEIDLYGAIYSGQGRTFVIPLPGEDPRQLVDHDYELLVMDEVELEKFLRQTDLLEIEGPGKAILRKSQRAIDQIVAWKVYERDGYRCRYCARKMPLTVDHVDLWEEGGAPIAENLLAACRRCNKLRGRTPYDVWIRSGDYEIVSRNLDDGTRLLNAKILGTLQKLRDQRVAHQRSR